MSSQVSPAVGLTMPSPHAASVQSALHVAVSPRSSQVSPAVAVIQPSPHAASVQAALHVADNGPMESHGSPSREITDDAIKFVDAHRDQRFFL